MGSNLTTVVVEARSLVREALKSLMAKNGYRVICDAQSTAQLSAAAVTEEPRLVILGARYADSAVAEAVAIGKLWPNSKIILLYEDVSLAEFQKLQTSEIDGCVPLSASPDTLIGMIDLIVTKGVRAMVVPGAQCLAIQPARPEHSHQSTIKMDRLQSDSAEREDVSVGDSAMHTEPPVNCPSTDPNLNNSDSRFVPALRVSPNLSGREAQVLEGLVKGEANKVIARSCGIAEATVKVHIKSILRKIRVGNRTQAAIWALKSGHAAAEAEGGLN